MVKEHNVFGSVCALRKVFEQKFGINEVQSSVQSFFLLTLISKYIVESFVPLLDRIFDDVNRK